MKKRGASFLWSVLPALFAAPAIAALEISDPVMPHDFGLHPVGATYPAQYFSVFNRGQAPLVISSVRTLPEPTATCLKIGCVTCLAISCPPAEPAPFVIAAGGDGCSNTTLPPGAGCSTLVGFAPYRGGAVEGEIVFSTADGQTVRGGLKGRGRDDPADCLFDWAEKTYPTLLTNPGPSIVVMPFYGRCYAGGALCVAADLYARSFSYAVASTMWPPSVYLYQNNALNRLGYFSDFARAAGCVK